MSTKFSVGAFFKSSIGGVGKIKDKIPVLTKTLASLVYMNDGTTVEDRVNSIIPCVGQYTGDGEKTNSIVFDKLPNALLFQSSSDMTSCIIVVKDETSVAKYNGDTLFADAYGIDFGDSSSKYIEVTTNGGIGGFYITKSSTLNDAATSMTKALKAVRITAVYDESLGKFILSKDDEFFTYTMKVGKTHDDDSFTPLNANISIDISVEDNTITFTDNTDGDNIFNLNGKHYTYIGIYTN